MSKAKSASSSFPSTQQAIVAGVVLSFVSILFYLLAPVETTNGIAGRPLWYRYGTYLLQTLAIASSGLLCLRNWRSPKIASGRNVWLGLGVGVVSWGLANLIFGYLDLIEGKPPSSPAITDMFYVISYASLSLGMALSVIGRRLNLLPKQWGIVAAIGTVGLAFAVYVTFIAGVKEGQAVNFTDPAKLLNTFYALGDVWMLVVATILLMAFWGGKFAQSWRLLGAAGIAMFFGDLAYNFALNVATESNPYQSGEWVEFFWILAFVLFGMGAALEFDLSSRPSSRKR
jgi:hypothetical protein